MEIYRGTEDGLYCTVHVDEGWGTLGRGSAGERGLEDREKDEQPASTGVETETVSAFLWRGCGVPLLCCVVHGVCDVNWFDWCDVRCAV